MIFEIPIEVTGQALAQSVEAKLRRNLCFKLAAPTKCAYEYSKNTHASSFARVEFSCTPSQSLSLSAKLGVWPSQLSEDEIRGIEASIFAAVGLLLVVDFYPHLAALQIEEIGWDDVRSSNVAFYLATAEAMRRLLQQADWAFAG